MPLIRFELRNEYGLGSSELYRGRASRKEDPKAVLDGVAVAGLVGILRQLGDLAELAADVFQDMHEQVSTISSRGRKMIVRIKCIEEKLPLLETAVHRQSSFLHFAYVEGSDWHAKIHPDKSLLRNALPKFMMDSYEECHDPPRLYLLDKFDSSGAGACFKRYSDPSYFKRIWDTSESAKSQQGRSKRMYPRNKRVGARLGSGVRFETTISQKNHRSRHLASPDSYPRCFSTENTSIRSNSIDFRERHGSDSTHKSFHNENTFTTPNNVEINKLPLSESHEKDDGPHLPDSFVEPQSDSPENFSQHIPEIRESGNRSPTIIWDEKTEIVKPTVPRSCDDAIMDRIQGSVTFPNSSEFANIADENGANLTGTNVDKAENLFDAEDVLEAASVLVGTHFDEVNSETDNYMDALNTMESEAETDSEYQTKREVKSSINLDPPIVSQHFLDKGNGLCSGDDNVVESASASFDHSDVENSAAFKKSVDENPPKSSNDSEVASPSENLVGDAISESQTVHATEKSSFEDDNGNLPLTSKIPSSQNISDGQQIPESSSSNLPQISTFTTKSNGVDFDSYSEIHDFKSSMTNDLGIRDNQSTKLSVARSEELVSLNNAPLEPSVRIWTNGNLLGLEPSKPSDFGHPCTKNVSQVSEVKLGGSSVSPLQSSSDLRRSTKNVSGKYEYVSYEGLHSRNTNSLEGEKTRIKGKNDEAEFLVGRKMDSRSSESSQLATSVSSGLSGLAQKLLASHLSINNGIHNSDIRNQQETKSFEFKSDEEFTLEGQLSQETKRKCFSVSSQHFGHSSPPLEHMKICLATGSEGSNLKLRFSNKSSCGSNEDLVFPSFQLLPGSAVPSPDGGLETDDESLCRSCPNSSEDIFSPRSDSNSNPWEDEETSTDRDPLYKTGEIEEIDTYGFGSTNGNMEHEIGLPFYGSLIADFSTLNSIEAQNDETKLVDHSMSKIPTRLPQFDDEENLPEQAISFTQPSPTVSSVPKTKDQELDEKTDFLQEIKNKALNLRRTTSLKSNPAGRMQTNLHIAAILEKASAIRQACVGSDDGRDGEDSWSD